VGQQPVDQVPVDRHLAGHDPAHAVHQAIQVGHPYLEQVANRAGAVLYAQQASPYSKSADLGCQKRSPRLIYDEPIDFDVSVGDMTATTPFVKLQAGDTDLVGVVETVRRQSRCRLRNDHGSKATPDILVLGAKPGVYPM
jgi:hypothetical protein